MGGLVGIDQGSNPLEISLFRPDRTSLMDQFPAKVEDRADEHHHVVGKECLDCPFSGKEDAVAVGEDHRGQEDEADPRRVGLEDAAVGESLAVEALGTTRPVEEDVGDADDNVVDDLRSCDQVDKPTEYLGTGIG